MTVFPIFRTCVWLDTMRPTDQAVGAVVFGVQTRRAKGCPWMNVATDGKPLFFDAIDKATQACAELRQSEKAKRRAAAKT